MENHLCRTALQRPFHLQALLHSVFLALLVQGAHSAMNDYTLVKATAYTQSLEGIAGEFPDDAYHARVLDVAPYDPTAYQTCEIYIPSGAAYPTNPLPHTAAPGFRPRFFAAFSDLATLNSNFPDDAYVFELTRSNVLSGAVNSYTSSVSFLTGTYPISIPTLLNSTWSDGVLVVPTNTTLLFNYWDDYTMNNSVITLELCSTNEHILISRALGSPVTSMAFPSNYVSLHPNTLYQGILSFTRIAASARVTVTNFGPVTTDIDFKVGLSHSTFFEMRTLPEPASLTVATTNQGLSLLITNLSVGVSNSLETCSDLFSDRWEACSSLVSTSPGEAWLITMTNSPDKVFFRIRSR
ncbi:MAG TPA: hypothetical protein PLE77_14135 [Kiritimatiellia bacterium]|nr:hypothetical protein [Kiritimatiellia bacterium]